MSLPLSPLFAIRVFGHIFVRWPRGACGVQVVWPVMVLLAFRRHASLAMSLAVAPALPAQPCIAIWVAWGWGGGNCFALEAWGLAHVLMSGPAMRRVVESACGSTNHAPTDVWASAR